MPTYKLQYFPARGRAEVIRLIFHAGGIKFVDERIESKDWPALKAKTPHGTLPSLIVDDQIIGQSLAIARYVARQAKLAGKTPMEELRADEIVDTVGDFGQAYIKASFEKDEKKKAELQKDLETTTIPNFIAKLSKLIKSSGEFFVGTSLTWADLAVFNMLDMLLKSAPNILDKEEQLKKFKGRIESIPAINTYLKNRPESKF